VILVPFNGDLQRLHNQHKILTIPEWIGEYLIEQEGITVGY